MPVDGHGASETERVVDDAAQSLSGLRGGTMEMGGIEERGVHHVQWELEQTYRVERLEDLRGPGPIADGAVVAARRIVGEAGLLERRRRVFVGIEPMHPDPDARASGDSSDLVELVAPLRAVAPRIDAVNADLTARRRQSRDPVRDVTRPVPRRPPPRGATPSGSSRVALEGNHEEGRAQARFELEVTVEVPPEVLREPQVNQRQPGRGRPVGEQTARGGAPGEDVDQRADEGAVEEAHHGVVEPMPANRRMIDIVSQAGNESTPVRDRRDLDQRGRILDDEIPQELDVHLHDRDVGVRRRLTHGEDRADLAKQVIADSHPHGVAGRQHDGRRLLRRFVGEAEPLGPKREAAPVDRDPTALVGQHRARAP